MISQSFNQEHDFSSGLLLEQSLITRHKNLTVNCQLSTVHLFNIHHVR